MEPWEQRRAFLDLGAIPPGTKQRLLDRVLGIRQRASYFETRIVFAALVPSYETRDEESLAWLIAGGWDFSG